ncbi:energy-coupling factor transporter ATPase [Pectinatus brassicae]|uniref:Energy-coupling factor transporter ATP-binding protein EcfA2 n=1 Tax=Pectinatus brassicae TaxID=862415 RepID=A0A840ULM8_9FIRM|nr:energy-coupling factor transporter ATPase [Pectinatus brassicae]MBB5337090.1 energy-coupling factor transport system ATP-binding protein [Pectinatus brassicae]
MAIEIKNVTYTYMKKTPYEKDALKNVSLTIDKGSFVAVAGHTGSGKSTLMQHLNGLLKPSDGQVVVDDIDINGKGSAVITAKRSVGMVFQYPEHQLFEETIFADIAFGPKNFGLDEAEITSRVQAAMEFVKLDYKKYKDMSPFALSGGQMRRVAIAGIIALQPRYLVLDEPTAGLDPQAKRDLLNNIRQLYDKGDTTVIMVSHNMDDIMGLAQRVIVLNNGEIAADGRPAEIFNKNAVLEQAGLRPPRLTQLLQKINDEVVPVKTNYTNVDAAAEAVSQAWHRRGKNA